MPNLTSEVTGKQARLYRLTNATDAPLTNAAFLVGKMDELGPLEVMAEMATRNFYDEPFERTLPTTKRVEPIEIKVASFNGNAHQSAFWDAIMDNTLLHFAIVIHALDAAHASGVSQTIGDGYRLSAYVSKISQAHEQSDYAEKTITITPDGGVTEFALT